MILHPYPAISFALSSTTFAIAGLAIIASIQRLTFGVSFSINSGPLRIRSAETFYCKKEISAMETRSLTSR